MEKFLLDNHEEILKIIQSKFYLAEPTPNLEKDILDYVKHVAVYQAMRTTSRYKDNVPINLGAPFPDSVVKDFKARLDELQGDYNEMLKQAHRAATEAQQTPAEPVKR